MKYNYYGSEITWKFWARLVGVAKNGKCLFLLYFRFVVSFNPWAFSVGAFWPLSLFCWRLLTTEPFFVAPFMYGAHFGGAFGHPHRFLTENLKNALTLSKRSNLRFSWIRPTILTYFKQLLFLTLFYLNLLNGAKPIFKSWPDGRYHEKYSNLTLSIRYPWSTLWWQKRS